MSVQPAHSSDNSMKKEDRQKLERQLAKLSIQKEELDRKLSNPDFMKKANDKAINLTFELRNRLDKQILSIKGTLSKG